jgi:hypothetical protein
VPGAGAGDNLAFVWNFWWARHVLEGGSAGDFRTGHLFAPIGTSLVLNTHSALQAWIGATLLGGLPLVRALNLVLLCGLAANGFATYLLAHAFTRRTWPSVVAGTAFASSAYVSVHLLGHFNLVHAWVVPVATLAWVSLIESPSAARVVVTGIAFAVVAWSDYYYLVYLTIFAAAWWGLTATEPQLSWRSERFPRAQRVLLIAACAALVVAAAIGFTSGLRFRLGPIQISAMRARNPVSMAGLCLLAWAVVRTRIVFARTPDSRSALRTAGHVVAAVAVSAVLVLPIAVAAVSLVRSGDYVSQQYFWRSAPRGVDLATAVLGNPMHALSGGWTRAADQRLGIDTIEQTAWLGIVPMLLLIGAIRCRTALPETARPWFWIAGIFAVWSLGPSLSVAGMDTGLLLPESLARYVPIVSNARIPGRALVFVQLAAAVLGAIAIARWNWSTSRMAAVTTVIVLEGLTAPYPLYRLPPPDAIDARIGVSTGIVVELPTGTRDGFGEWGRFDQRALAHQIGHARPLVGGAVSRVPPRVTAAYRGSAAIRSLIELSSGEAAVDSLPRDLGRLLSSLGVRFVIVNTDVMGVPLREALASRGVTFVIAAGTRELYRTVE